MLLKSGFIVAVFTMLSRLFGLAREFFIAALFGTSSVADCVNVAFKFPNLFRRIFGEGALSAVFIPMYSEKLTVSRGSAQEFGAKIFSLLIFSLIALTIIVQIFMPYMMYIIAPGFSSDLEKFNLAVVLCRITAPYLIFISATAMIGGMLNSVKRFAAFAFVPIILNISIILVTIIFQKFADDEYGAEYGIAYSLIFGGIFQLLFMYICLKKANLCFRLRRASVKDKEVNKLLVNMGPAAMSSGAQQLMLFISQSIASFLPGAVSILSYAERLYQLPLALIGISFGTVLLPELSKLYKQKDHSAANSLQNKALMIALLLSVPAMIGLFTLSEPIIHLIFERGAFSREDTIATAAALAAFSFGVPAFVISKILTPIFYANLDTKTPMRLTIYSLIINTILNLILMIPFGYVGIALGSSMASWINICFLAHYAKRYGNFKIKKEVYSFGAKVLLCSMIMGLFAYACSIYMHDSLFSDNTLVKMLSLFGTIAISAFIYLFALYLLKVHQYIDINLIKKTR